MTKPSAISMDTMFLKNTFWTVGRSPLYLTKTAIRLKPREVMIRAVISLIVLFIKSGLQLKIYNFILYPVNNFNKNFFKNHGYSLTYEWRDFRLFYVNRDS